MHERVCAGFALAASYWKLPAAAGLPTPTEAAGADSDGIATDVSVPVTELAHGGAAIAALNARCEHPTYVEIRPRHHRPRDARP